MPKSVRSTGKTRTLSERRREENVDIHCSFDESDESHQVADIVIPCTQLVSQDKILEGMD